MFVLAIKFNAVKGKDEKLVQSLRKVITKVRQNEPDTLMYDIHYNVDNPTEIFLYERYKDKRAWEVTHMSAPYIKELLAELPNYLEVDAEVTYYETIEVT